MEQNGNGNGSGMFVGGERYEGEMYCDAWEHFGKEDWKLGFCLGYIELGGMKVTGQSAVPSLRHNSNSGLCMKHLKAVDIFLFFFPNTTSVYCGAKQKFMGPSY